MIKKKAKKIVKKITKIKSKVVKVKSKLKTKSKKKSVKSSKPISTEISLVDDFFDPLDEPIISVPTINEPTPIAESTPVIETATPTEVIGDIVVGSVKVTVKPDITLNSPNTKEQEAGIPKVVNGDNFEGVRRLDTLPFKEQIDMVFNPLHTITKTTVSDAVSASTHIVEHTPLPQG